ncbi:hypothetical protein ACQ4M3_07395 [Leptolyngbya sp. AN03gr2]|uniref:hypothetical protein n=1 Tax=unclassified Leptolyngbya TaxID=2650499 RepID=UPI003D31D3D8
MIAIGYCVAKFLSRYSEDRDQDQRGDHYRIVSRHRTLAEAIKKKDWENLTHDYSTFDVFIVGIDGKYYKPTERQKYLAQYPKLDRYHFDLIPPSYLQLFWKKWLRGATGQKNGVLK